MLVLPVLFLATALCWGQDELTLEQAIALALKSNRIVRAAQLEVMKADDQVLVARTYRLPQFNVRLYELQLLARSNFLFPAGVFGLFPPIGSIPPINTPVNIARRPASIIFAQANQPISQLGRIKLGVQLQELASQIAKEKLRSEENNLTSQVKTAYYNLLQTQSALEATEEALKLFRELNRVAGEGLSQQVILKSDVLEAQAGMAKTELDAVMLRNTGATLKERINGLLARDLNTDFKVRGALDPTDWELDMTAARARALEQRPELREAKLKVQQAEKDYRMKKREYIPDVSLTFNYLSPFNVQVVPKNLAGAGFAINWDVFDFGRRKHELAAKSRTIEQAGAAVDETSAQIMVDVGNRFRKFQEARQQLRVTSLARDVAQEKVRVGLDRYQQKAVLLKDVLQLQTSLAESRYKYQESLLAFWSARAELEKAMGER
ncbi:MAG TPA: TolC family protein [Bryobacteraceae bacterium]|nr:TolC family protein [Bryobacteraceae bacterium]